MSGARVPSTIGATDVQPTVVELLRPGDTPTEVIDPPRSPSDVDR